MMIEISGKSTNFWLKNAISVKKQPVGKVQSFLKSNFGLKQGYKTIKFGTFNATDLLYIFIMIGEML